MVKAISFIHTDSNSWDVINYPQIESEQNIPVISCIGSARDGKSTFLNLYHNWFQKNINKNNAEKNVYNKLLLFLHHPIKD